MPSYEETVERFGGVDPLTELVGNDPLVRYAVVATGTLAMAANALEKFGGEEGQKMSDTIAAVAAKAPVEVLMASVLLLNKAKQVVPTEV